MAYKSTRTKGEDPNAESRTKAPLARPVTPPAAPYVQNPAGGAPRVNPQPTTNPKPPSIVGPGGTQSPGTGISGPPSLVGPGGTQYPQMPNPFRGAGAWQTRPAPPSAPSTRMSQSAWSLKDVAAAEPEVTKQIQDLLWQRYQATPEKDRSGVFWQGVKQNPQLAAASFVRRMLDNMKTANDLMNGTTPPTLSAAASATTANSETRQWLDWVRGNRKVMPRRVV